MNLWFRLGWAVFLWVVQIGVLFSASEGREALRLSLPQDLARLTQAHEQLRAAYAAAGSTLPTTFNDVVVVRKTIAADWQKKLNDTKTAVEDQAVARFHHDLIALIAATQQLSNTAQQYSYASQRFAHCLHEPVLQKYRAILVADVDAGLQAIIAGRTLENSNAMYRIQRRYTDLLTVIESQHTIDERYGNVPANLPALVAYREHLRVTRAKLEPALEIPDQLENEFNLSSITYAFEELLDAMSRKMNY